MLAGGAGNSSEWSDTEGWKAACRGRFSKILAPPQDLNLGPIGYESAFQAGAAQTREIQSSSAAFGQNPRCRDPQEVTSALTRCAVVTKLSDS